MALETRVFYSLISYAIVLLWQYFSKRHWSLNDFESASYFFASLRWLRWLNSGNFDLKDKERLGLSKKFEDAELVALLDKTIRKLINESQRGLVLVAEPFMIVCMPWDRSRKRKTVCQVLLSRQERKTFFASDRYWR